MTSLVYLVEVYSPNKGKEVKAVFSSLDNAREYAKTESKMPELEYNCWTKAGETEVWTIDARRIED